MLIDKEVHPEELMKGISDTTLVKKIMLSLGLHVLLLGITSIGFIGLCVKYTSFDPQAEIKKEEAGKKAAAEEAEAKAAAEKAKNKKKGTKAKPDKTTPSGQELPATQGQTKPKKSKIERDLEKTSKERPGHSEMSFDDVDEF